MHFIEALCILALFLIIIGLLAGLGVAIGHMLSEDEAPRAFCKGCGIYRIPNSPCPYCEEPGA